MFIARLLLITLACLAGPATSIAKVVDDPMSGSRQQFLDALVALDHRRLGEFKQLAGGLKDYPLYPYLEYRELRKRMKKASHREVANFINRYSDQPTGHRMRRAWLYVLADQGKWREFLSVYANDQPTRLQCYRLQAKIKTRDSKDLVDEALGLWMVGHSQDKACDPVFAYLEKKGELTKERTWQRIRLAMLEGQPSLAKYLARKLPKADRQWVSVWLDARVKPASTLASGRLSADVPRAREIILYTVRRIARGNLDEARETWSSLKTRYNFDHNKSAELDRRLALLAAWRRHPDAHDWLMAVPDSAVDPEVREWRTRTAVAAGLWEKLLGHVAQMPQDEAEREEWRYWKARAFRETGAVVEATDSFTRLARERDYHGFLAADELEWPYEMGNRPLDLNPDDIAAIEKRPGLTRARELYLARQWTDARREWHHAIKDLSTEEYRLAAALAHSWGWHDRAILTVARAQDFDDLVLRFPLNYRERVEQQASENKLDPGHVFAVIRQESAFNPDARSSAGARGLMQLMPRTGQITARKYSIPLGGLHKLYDADKNISIGTAYLGQVMNDYDRNIVLASAAYNAGPHRVKRWLPKEGRQEAERWIAMVPFDETRKYIQRVLAYAAISTGAWSVR